MANKNTNILNNIPFGDKNLKNTITSLQKETGEVTYYLTGSATTNPTTTATTLLSYTVDYPVDRPFELKLEALVKLTSNLSGDQEFTFGIYDVDDAATPFSFGPIDIPDALNTAIAVKVDWTMRATNSTTAPTQFIEFGELTVYSLDGGSVTSVVVPTRKVETAEDAIKNLRLRVTAETGTATTAVQLLSGKVTLDTQVWN